MQQWERELTLHNMWRRCAARKSFAFDS